MAAVIAAIFAGFIAVVVALFREHRIQERKLLVAARVIDEILVSAERGITVSLETDSWAAFNRLPTYDAFLESWAGYREDLAGHLDGGEWQNLAVAVAAYETTRAMTQEEPPGGAKEVLQDVPIC